MIVFISANRVKLETTALKINNHPFTDEIIDNVLKEAQEIYETEQAFVKSGRDLDEFEIDKSKLLQTMPDLELKFSRNESEQTNDQSQPRIMGVISQARHVNTIQKAIRNYKEKSADMVGGRSKACVIL